MAATGLVMAAPLAMADSHDDDGINAVNGNNISAVPVQLCGNDVAAVIGVIANIASPDITNCVNAPITEDSGNSLEIEHEVEHEHNHDH